MPIQIRARSVVAHGGAGVGVVGGDLHIAPVYTDVEHGGDERVPEHVRVHPRRSHHRCLRQPPEASASAVPVYSPASGVEQNRYDAMRFDVLGDRAVRIRLHADLSCAAGSAAIRSESVS